MNLVCFLPYIFDMLIKITTNLHAIKMLLHDDTTGSMEFHENPVAMYNLCNQIPYFIIFLLT